MIFWYDGCVYICCYETANTSNWKYWNFRHESIKSLVVVLFSQPSLAFSHAEAIVKVQWFSLERCLSRLLEVENTFFFYLLFVDKNHRFCWDIHLKKKILRIFLQMLFHYILNIQKKLKNPYMFKLIKTILLSSSSKSQSFLGQTTERVSGHFYLEDGGPKIKWTSLLGKVLLPQLGFRSKGWGSKKWEERERSSSSWGIFE